ncbi:hypothetical protein PERMA_A0053 (plasmid) [Persephonella marina EX-H1]|uniref:Uncharacterized protein n=1 Tax=Persephonella marina (strain DSM 14350 / EX-H1) TaxID=123214 RepID=C0QUY2_PERMH|nr:hypothetical protein [Persephonella marina]ACO04943.1 hypothetical protein PERMA_A0053 [Persephonella marina EX-H1]
MARRKSKKNEEIKETKKSKKEEKVMEEKNQEVLEPEVELVETTAEEVLGEEPETKPAPAVKEEVSIAPANEFSFDTLRERLSSVLKENVNACVKINGRLEITRPVALAMLNQLSRSIAGLGGTVRIKKDVLSVNPIIVKAICEIQLPNGAMLEFQALGNAEEDDIRGNRDKEIRIYHDALGTAETRATKRLLEEVVGEDFINKVLVPLMEKMGHVSNGNGKKSNGDKPATQKQKDLIQKLIDEGKIKDKVDLDKLTMAQASQLLDKVFKKSNNTKTVASSK